MNASDSSLKANSISSLSPGTYIKYDVYSFDSTKLLIESGTFLDEKKLEKLKNLNSNKDLIYTKTFTLPSQNIDDNIDLSVNIDLKRQNFEKETGYTSLINETVEMFSTITGDKVVEQQAIKDMSHKLSNSLETTSPDTILSLINALAPVDEYLQRHCVNTSLLNGLIGKWLGLTKSTIDRLVLIGLLHDCGKALTPPSILNASRSLTMAEFEVIKMHTINSYELLSEFPEAIRRAVRNHHEKANGTGYPDKLSLSAIPVESRITALSDIYDAMVSRRSYKEPRSPFNIMAFLTKLSGKELDPKLVSLFIKRMPSKLIGKQVMMSDGKIGVVVSYDANNIEYPIINIDGKNIETNKNLYCTYMC